MALPKTLKMKSIEGHIEIPTVGFGTWAFGDNSWCSDATLHAIQAGYRHLDCAWHYGVSLCQLFEKPLKIQTGSP